MRWRGSGMSDHVGPCRRRLGIPRCGTPIDQTARGSTVDLVMAKTAAGRMAPADPVPVDPTEA